MAESDWTRNKRYYHALSYASGAAVSVGFVVAYWSKLIDGRASMELFLVAAFPAIVLAGLAAYIFLIELLTHVVYGKKFLALGVDIKPNWKETALYFSPKIYSALLSFQHAYILSAFAVTILWYQSPADEHLEPLAVYFGALAALMEWFRWQWKGYFGEKGSGEKGPDPFSGE